MKKLLLLISIVAIRQIHGQIITTVAGNGVCCNPMDGVPATSNSIYSPNGVAIDALGNIYIAEANSIRKVDASSGLISTVAGTWYGGYTGDGGPATQAEVEAEGGVAIDAAGNIYILDWYNKVLRKVNTSGIIHTIAGGGINYPGDGGQATAAKLIDPNGIAVDAAGNVYISDGNRIRKISTSGIITTVAGNGTQGFSGDGGLATAAELYEPIGVAIDVSGNLFIADWQNNRVRKVNTSGIISTIAGNGNYGFSGNGGLATAAQLWNPSGVSVDASGNIFIADVSNKVVRMVDINGIINNVAGDTTYGYTGDGGLATTAELEEPWGIAVSSGNLFIADVQADVIRKVTNVVNGISNYTKEESISIYPNPTSDQFFIDANTNDKITIDLFDVNGSHVFSKTVNDKSNINVATLDNGIYTLTVKSVDRVTNKKLVIVR